MRLRRPATVAAATFAALVLLAPAANAWPWDAHVDLNGNASCHTAHADMVNISLDNGETSAAVPNNYGTYFISFFRISSGGTNGTAYTRAPDGSWCSRRITVKRPVTGNTQYFVLNM